jgi:hypothetical protein
MQAPIAEQRGQEAPPVCPKCKELASLLSDSE